MSATRPGPQNPTTGNDLELLFFGPASDTTLDSSPFSSEKEIFVKDKNGNIIGKRILFTANEKSSLDRVSEDREFWVPLKHQAKNPRLALVFNNFIAQLRLACHRLCAIFFSITPKPNSSDVVELANYSVQQAVTYCAVHGIAYAYATVLNKYQVNRKYVTTCVDILISGYPASQNEFLALALSEFRKNQNTSKPVDIILSDVLVKQKNTLPRNYRSSCWFHSACAFLMPHSRSVFNFLKRYEMEEVYVEGAIQANIHIPIILEAISNSLLEQVAMHRVGLPITETLVKFLYEAMRIICERRSTPMLNLIEIFTNMYTPGSEDYGLPRLQRTLDKATDTAINLVTPFSFPWKLAPTESASNIFMDSQSCSSKMTFVTSINEYLLASMGSKLSQFPSRGKIYRPASSFDTYSAVAANTVPTNQLILKGKESMAEPYIAINAQDNERILMHIVNAGYPPRMCFFLKRHPIGNKDYDPNNSFSSITNKFMWFEVNNTTYALASCLFYSPGHYRMRYRDMRTLTWYEYDDVTAKMSRVPSEKSDAECNALMIVRTKPIGEQFSQTLMEPIREMQQSPYFGTTKTKKRISLTIFGYEDFDASDLRRCEYILATNGLSPTSRGLIYYAEMRNWLHRPDLQNIFPFAVICVYSDGSIDQLIKLASGLPFPQSRMAVICYGPMQKDLTQLTELSRYVAVMVVPHLSREVCALTQQLCTLISKQYRNMNYHDFIAHIWRVYSNPTLRHQYFMNGNFTVPSPDKPVFHRWIPYVKKGHYLFICHADRLSYLTTPKSEELGVFNRETVEVWGKNVVNSLDELDIPYKSKWFIYHSKNSCYLDENEIGRVMALLSNADCEHTRIDVD